MFEQSLLKTQMDVQLRLSRLALNKLPRMLLLGCHFVIGDGWKRKLAETPSRVSCPNSSERRGTAIIALTTLSMRVRENIAQNRQKIPQTHE